MGFWQRWRDPLNLNARLEARRSRPRPDFVQQLSDELTGNRRAAGRRLRLALAGALTLMMLVAAGSIGGGATAASFKRPVASVIKTVNQVLEGKKATPRQEKRFKLAHEDDDETDDHQYKEERRQCRRAVIQAHQGFHQQQNEAHQTFHEAPYTSDEHRAFHEARREAHAEYHETVFKPAMEECNQIGRE